MPLYGLGMAYSAFFCFWGTQVACNSHQQGSQFCGLYSCHLSLNCWYELCSKRGALA
jgi:hypothetical protein